MEILADSRYHTLDVHLSRGGRGGVDFALVGKGSHGRRGMSLDWIEYAHGAAAKLAVALAVRSGTPR